MKGKGLIENRLHYFTESTWNIINHELGKTKISSGNITLNVNGENKSSTKVCELFANCFSNTASKSIQNVIGQNMSLPYTASNVPAITCQFNEFPITSTEVLEAMKAIKNTKSLGINGLSLKTLGHVIDLLMAHLLYLFNTSLLHGIFPGCLKTALVVPIHKRGCKKDIDDHRQISILNCISKLFEKVICIRITNHLENNSLLAKGQHGFRVGRSIESASSHMLNFIFSHLDSNKEIVSLFFDLTKPFDSVDPIFLSSKLHALQFPRNIVQWIHSYMSNRKMIVSCNGGTSSSQGVQLGALQGSMLGPILFLCYINDVPTTSKIAV
nr:unnamed protein product [Callosobruchus analis]